MAITGPFYWNKTGGTFPSQGGVPVLIGEDAFEECCCSIYVQGCLACEDGLAPHEFSVTFTGLERTGAGTCPCELLNDTFVVQWVYNIPGDPWNTCTYMYLDESITGIGVEYAPGVVLILRHNWRTNVYIVEVHGLVNVYIDGVATSACNTSNGNDHSFVLESIDCFDVDLVEVPIEWPAGGCIFRDGTVTVASV